MPDDFPPDDLIRLPEARTLEQEKPIPPADLEMREHRFHVSVMPSMESSLTGSRKQEARCGLLVPALNMVGVACVNMPLDIMRNVSRARSRSPQ